MLGISGAVLTIQTCNKKWDGSCISWSWRLVQVSASEAELRADCAAHVLRQNLTDHTDFESRPGYWSGSGHSSNPVTKNHLSLSPFPQKSVGQTPYRRFWASNFTHWELVMEMPQFSWMESAHRAETVSLHPLMVGVLDLMTEKCVAAQ